MKLSSGRAPASFKDDCSTGVLRVEDKMKGEMIGPKKASQRIFAEKDRCCSVLLVMGDGFFGLFSSSAGSFGQLFL